MAEVQQDSRDVGTRYRERGSHGGPTLMRIVDRLLAD